MHMFAEKKENYNYVPTNIYKYIYMYMYICMGKETNRNPWKERKKGATGAERTVPQRSWPSPLPHFSSNFQSPMHENKIKKIKCHA